MASGAFNTSIDYSDDARINRNATTLRLYRGLKEAYAPSRAIVAGASGVDFSDCPYTALTYASGRKGVVLIVEVDGDSSRVTEEFWLNRAAKRFMIWTSFAHLVIAKIPAKELRAQVRRRGIVTASDHDKAMVLRRYIDGRLRDADKSRP